MPTFVHTADLHLDTAFSAHFTSEQARLRRGEMLRCFSDILDKGKDADILLISGDLFDTSRVSIETISFIKRKFLEIPDTHIFICCGNHDPYIKTSVYAREEFPENVHIFKDTWECVELPQIKTRVFGISFSDETARLTDGFKPIEKFDGTTDIIIIHGDVVSENSDSEYNPICKSFIESCNADYIALGHIHKRTELMRLGRTYYAYPGNPFGRGFDECGDMGYYYGKINDGVVEIEFKKVCARRFFKLNIDISGASDSYDACEIIKKTVFAVGSENDLYKISLTGRVSADTISFDVIENEVKGILYYVEIKNNTKEDYDVAALEKQNNLCGEFIRHMKADMLNEDDEGKEIMEEALTLGIEVLTGGGLL